MNFLDALILGIVEGLTEFLPVSSTGHLILTSSLLGISENPFVKSFEIIIQLGAILAVVVLYRKRFIGNFALMYKVIAAFIPTAVIGLALYSFIKRFLLGNVTVVIASLFVGGVVLILFEKFNVAEKFRRTKNGLAETEIGRESSATMATLGVSSSGSSSSSVESISTKQAVYIGLFQAIALIPGVSRSAATIIGGELLGLSRKTIVEFSFLLAVPVMLAASAFDILKNPEIFSLGGGYMLATGFITAFIVAIFAIKGFVSYIERHTFTAFGVYRILVAAVFLALLFV